MAARRAHGWSVSYCSVNSFLTRESKLLHQAQAPQSNGLVLHSVLFFLGHPPQFCPFSLTLCLIIWGNYPFFYLLSGFVEPFAIVICLYNMYHFLIGNMVDIYISTASI